MPHLAPVGKVDYWVRPKAKARAWPDFLAWLVQGPFLWSVRTIELLSSSALPLCVGGSLCAYQEAAKSWALESDLL